MASESTYDRMLHYVRCSCGNESYALDMAWLLGIERLDLLRHEPGANGLEGWLPGRGGDIPVFSLAKRLGRPMEMTGAQRRILVLNPAPPKEDGPWGLLVDRVSRVNQIDKDRLAALPPIAVNPSAQYFRGVIIADGELVLLLRPDQLHPEAEFPAPAISSLLHVAPIHTGSDHEKTRRKQQILVFSTANAPAGERPVSFALSIGQVPEILDLIPQIPMPGAPPYVLGLGNWRDHPVPILDLNARLGLPFPSDLPPGERHRLLIARAGTVKAERLAGLVIRSHVRALQLPLAHRICVRDLALQRSLIHGMVELDNETLIVPNMPALL